MNRVNYYISNASTSTIPYHCRYVSDSLAIKIPQNTKEKDTGEKVVKKKVNLEPVLFNIKDLVI